MKRRHTIASRRRRFFPLRSSQNADVILRDSFTDSNGTSIADHTPDRNSPGNAWVLVDGTLQVQSNRLENRGSAGPHSHALIDLETANVDITSTINCGDAATGSHPGTAIRYQDTTHYWRAYYNSIDQKIVLSEYNGTTTIRAEAAVTLNNNTDYRIRVLARSDYIKVVAHDGTILTYTSSTFASNTKHGVCSSFYGAVTNYPYMDDLKIKRGLAE